MGKAEENIATLKVDMRYVKESVDDLRTTMTDHIAVSTSKSEDHHDRIKAMEDILKFLKLFAKYAFIPLALLWPALMPLIQHYILKLFDVDVALITFFLLPWKT